jgi:hypothetical protein
MVPPDRLWYRTKGLSVLIYLPGQLPGIAPGWGEQYMFLFDWSALMTPQKATLLDSMRTLL